MTIFTFAVLCVANPAAERASAIAEQAGVAGGLVVHIGCGDGVLTAALSMDARFMVQGLALDAADGHSETRGG